MKLNQWSKEKPAKPCIVAVRWRISKNEWEYDIAKLYLVDEIGICVAVKNIYGDWDDCKNDYEDWNFDEYMILEMKDDK